jgi:hypothetical protein
VAAFRRDILQDAFADHIAFLDYESYADILKASGNSDAAELAGFLSERIGSTIDWEFNTSRSDPSDTY